MKYFHILAAMLFGASLFTVSFVKSETVLNGKSAGMEFHLTRIAKGLGTPWGMAFVAPERLLITERSGKLFHLDLKTNRLDQVAGLPEIAARGQGGLLDIRISPNFQTDKWIYFSYSSPTRNPKVNETTLARAQFTPYRLVRLEILLQTRSGSNSNKHFGSRIAFDHQGHVYFGIGDRGIRSGAQDRSTHAGSILRLKLDGTQPADNPFARRDGMRPEIWSFGHRNPQGLVFDEKTNRLWSNEHGPRGGDEINLIKKGRNYGWPLTSHGKEYWGPVSVGNSQEKEGIEPPRKVYVPSIAPGSLMIVNSNKFPAWKGNLLSGALRLKHINRVIVDAAGHIVAEERLLEDLDERIRNLTEGPDGLIYISTDSGNLYRLSPGQG